MNFRVVVYLFMILVAVLFACRVSAQESIVSRKGDTLRLTILKSYGSQRFVRKSIQKNRDVKFLSIQSEASGWSVFPYHKGEVSLVRDQSYTLTKIPKKIGSLLQLESLNISALGLNRLPTDMSKLKRLRILDISFNAIDLKKTIDIVKNMDNLQLLSAFGLQVDGSTLNEFQTVKPNLVIRFTSEHFKEDQNKF